MFSVLKSRLKKNHNSHANVQENKELPSHIAPKETVDEEILRQRIANKLQKYRPEERDANFTGIKYYRDSDF